MAGTNSISGIVSGMDTANIVEQLVQLDSGSLQIVQAKKTLAEERKSVWQDLNLKLLDFKLKAYATSRPLLYTAKTATSSNEAIVKASTTSAAVKGTYSLTVKQLAVANQMMSSGFHTTTQTFGSGSITIKTGGGYVNQSTPLAMINGLSGFERGKIKIIDKSGNEAIIDLSAANTIQDVIDKINNTSEIQVSAALSSNRKGLTITDTSGGAGSLVISDVEGGNAAGSLGIEGQTAGNQIVGTDILYLTMTASLNYLNERTGVRTVSGADDIRITTRDGSSYDIDLSNAETIQDIADAIYAGTENKVTLELSADKDSLVVTDSTTGASNFSISSINNSYTADDLGITGTTTGATISGKKLIAGFNDILLKRLNGGAGVDTTNGFTITDKSGGSDTIDISSAQTLQDVLTAINNAAGVSVTAAINSAGTGILLTDTSGGTGTFQVAENGGTSAADLGIFASEATKTTINGTDLKLQYISRVTLLSDLNGGTGVNYGKIEITDRAGNSAEVDLSDKDAIRTVGDVIDAINNTSGISVLARINDDGDGIIVYDLTGEETSDLTISEVNGGRMAADLNIKGSDSTNQKVHGTDLSYLSSTTPLSRLNDGMGVNLGTILIVDRSGNSANIDLSGAVTIQDVLDAINNESGIDITAELDTAKNAIKLTDGTGQGGLLIVSDISGTAAEDLGIATTGTNYYIYNGKKILSPLNDRQLDFLNGQAGVSGTSFSITDSLGRAATIDISSARTVQDVVDIINNTSAVSVEAAISDDGLGIKITDTAGGSGALAVTEGDGAAASLGILKASVAGVIQGDDILYLDTSSSVNYIRDGLGIDTAAGLDDLRITAKDGSLIDINLDGITDVQSILDAINNDTDNGGKVSASLSTDGLSLVITDNTGGGGNLSISALNGSLAAKQLGIETTTTGSTITGEYLISTLGDKAVDNLNDFSGITSGSFTIYDRTGSSAVITIDGTERFLSDILDKINTSGLALEATAAEDGSGIVIKDTSGQEGAIVVEDNAVSQSLGINNADGVYNTGYDGSYTIKVAIDSDDDLSDIASAINDATDTVTAYVINDGSGINPYKLIVSSAYTGSLGKVVLDARLSGGDGLTFNDTVKAKDAVVLVGSTDSSFALVSHTNNISGGITGLTLNLVNASDETVTVKVDANYDEIVSAMNDFISAFNDIMDFIKENTKYDVDTGDIGVLQGNTTAMLLQSSLLTMVTDPVDGLPSEMNHISAVGITMDTEGHLSLNESKLREKLEQDAEAVERLFNYEEEVSLASAGGSASAASTYTGYSVLGAINGNTSEDDFGPGVNGWQNSVAGESSLWFELAFSRQVALSKVVLYGLSTTGSRITGYNLEYWYNNQWNIYREITGNLSATKTHYFTLPYYTDKIRLSNIQSEDGYARIVELEAYEAKGVGSRINNRLAYITDPGIGLIANEIDNLDSNIKVYDQQIEVYQARLDRKKEYLTEQFTQMEEMMGQFQSMSNWLSTQLANISSTRK